MIERLEPYPEYKESGLPWLGRYHRIGNYGGQNSSSGNKTAIASYYEAWRRILSPHLAIMRYVRSRSIDLRSDDFSSNSTWTRVS